MALGIPECSVLTILHDNLNIRKVSAKLVPQLMTLEWKLHRLQIFEALDKDIDFLAQIVTMKGF